MLKQCSVPHKVETQHRNRPANRQTLDNSLYCIPPLRRPGLQVEAVGTGSAAAKRFVPLGGLLARRGVHLGLRLRTQVLLWFLWERLLLRRLPLVEGPEGCR